MQMQNGKVWIWVALSFIVFVCHLFGA